MPFLIVRALRAISFTSLPEHEPHIIYQSVLITMPDLCYRVNTEVSFQVIVHELKQLFETFCCNSLPWQRIISFHNDWCCIGDSVKIFLLQPVLVFAAYLSVSVCLFNQV